MENTQKKEVVLRSDRSAGDTAVDGLLGGLVAGVIMGCYLLIAGWLTGTGMEDVLQKFSLQQTGTPFTGALSHLATSAIYGTLFGIFSKPLRGRLPLWIAGLIYAMVLFGVAIFALLPGLNSPLLEIPPSHFGISHLIYGLVLGLLTSRD